MVRRKKKNPAGGRNKGKAKEEEKKAMACGRLKNTVSHSDAQIIIKTEVDEANEAQLLECIKV